MFISRSAVCTASIAAAVGFALALAGCSADVTDDADSGALKVVSAFYPLQFAAERVGGERVQTTNLTPPGAEPHDLELTPRQVAELQEADLVIYLEGFQPAVDDAVAALPQDRVLEVSEGLATLKSQGHEDGESHEGDDVHSDEGDDVVDPHIWLDPTLMDAMADRIASRLTGLDEQGAPAFAANLSALQGDLSGLDEEWKSGVAECASRDLVVSHEAFGYLAARYDFEQVGVTGLSPEAEPTARQIAEVTDFVRTNDVQTIYFETLVDPKVAQTVANETGARAVVLDPLEGLAEDASGDYLSVMRDNLAVVQEGQNCQ